MGREGWIQTTLNAEVDLLTGFPFKSESYTATPTGIRLLRGDNIIQGRLRWDGAKRWPADQAADVEKYQLREGDVVVAMDRPWIEAGLKYAAMSEDDLPSLLVQRVARLRGTETLDTGFLRYLIGSEAFKNHILAVQTGTAVPHISGSQIKEFRFLRPPLRQQKAIAFLLGSLDSKIELNYRTNQSLDAMARAIFKSWFVDFDPVREGQAGWRTVSLDSIATFLNGLALQKFPADEDEGFLPVIKIAELRKGNTDGSDKAGLNVPEPYVIEDGDVLFSWSGTLEVTVWTGGRGALNQHLFKVSSDRFPKWFYLHWIKKHLPAFRAIASSKATTMGHIQRRHLTEAMVAVPPDSTIERWDRVMAPLLARQVANNLESRTLAALRDTLLPKLLAGEIRVKQAEKIVGEAV